MEIYVHAKVMSGKFHNETCQVYGLAIWHKQTSEFFKNSEVLLWVMGEVTVIFKDDSHFDLNAVGNRLTQTASIGGIVTTTTYTYDHANRLATVNGQAYSYNNNSNLTYDGTTTYTGVYPECFAIEGIPPTG